MSHDHANCDDARHTLYEFLDGELTAEVKLQIQQHLEACAPCFEKFDFEAEVLQIVSKKCTETLPPGLTDKILAALRADGGTQIKF